MINVVVGFALIVLTAMFALLAVAKSGMKRKSKVKPNRVLSLVASVVAGVGALAFILIPPSIRTVEAGKIAVVKELGEAKEVRSAGTYFDFWILRSYQYYDATVQNLAVATQAYSKDAQTMDIQMTVQYQIKTEDAVQIANQYRELMTLENRIQSVAIEKMKARLSSYSAMEIIENRSKISPQVEEDIIQAIGENYHVTINTVVLTNIDFSEAFEKIVEDKMIAEQEKLKAEYEKQTAIINAEKEFEVAKKKAEAAVETAKADAEAQKLAAKAEAEAIAYKSVEVARMLGFSIVETVEEETVTYSIDFEGKTAEEIRLISEYLKYIEYLDAWNGELPNTVVTNGSNASIILPTPNS